MIDRNYDYSLMKELTEQKIDPQELAATLDEVARDYLKRIFDDKHSDPTRIFADRIEVLFLIRNAFFKMTGECEALTEETC